MAALPYMQFYVAEYLADTMQLRADEHGAYMLLLFQYWQTGDPLPDDDEYLTAVTRTASDRWPSVRKSLERYFDIHDGVWVHHRIDDDLATVKEKVDKASKAGKASAHARKRNRIHARKAEKQRAGNGRSTNVPTNVPTKRQPNVNQSESESERESKTCSSSIDDGFADFWALYPRKVGKKEAHTAWHNLNPSTGFTGALLSDIKQRMQVGAWVPSKSEKQFIPHPATYLNGERWKDEITPRSGPGAVAPGATRGRSLSDDLSDRSWAE